MEPQTHNTNTLNMSLCYSSTKALFVFSVLSLTLCLSSVQAQAPTTEMENPYYEEGEQSLAWQGGVNHFAYLTSPVDGDTHPTSSSSSTAPSTDAPHKSPRVSMADAPLTDDLTYNSNCPASLLYDGNFEYVELLRVVLFTSLHNVHHNL